jgi:hypothetical protein
LLAGFILSGQQPQKYDKDTYEYGGSRLSELEQRGRNTWYFWTGGGENFWRRVAVITDGTVDLLQFVDGRRRGQRFRTLGTINDPDCRAASKPDEYGMWMDECDAPHVPDIPGMPSGVIGLRKFKNPKFDKVLWSPEKYYAHPKDVEPPWIIGMACGVCHIGFNPLNPPADPENPRWSNLSPAFGNQYFEEGKLFILNMKPNDFRWHVGARQPAGTSDTSRFATDHIYNPNAINSIFNLGDRPSHMEKQRDGSMVPVHHILKDGADSIGTAGASLRVYVNIGMCSDYWTTLHDPIYGLSMAQKPFEIEKARKDCEAWRQTEARMGAAEAFLKTIGPMKLKDAPGGERYLTKDQTLLNRGKTVFAENCARCHSSKQPPADMANNPQQAQAWFREAVMKDDFLDHNFLSDDRRYSVREIGTNFARAMASNAIRGHVWEQFSSETYKDQPPVGMINGLYNPVRPTKPLDFNLEGGGRGYYRVPTLVSVWASAPLLHNNSLGIYTHDPSVEGRMSAFNDAIEKLLWPERRLGVQSIPVTTMDTELPLGASNRTLRVPVGTPIALIARIDATRMTALRNDTPLSRALGWLVGRGTLNGVLLRRNLAPDFIEDRGHTFGSNLSDEDKRALIEFVKTF